MNNTIDVTLGRVMVYSYHVIIISYGLNFQKIFNNFNYCNINKTRKNYEIVIS